MKYWRISIRMQEKVLVAGRENALFEGKKFCSQGTSFPNHADLGMMTRKQALSTKSDQIAPTCAFLLDSLAPLSVMENEESTLCRERSPGLIPE